MSETRRATPSAIPPWSVPPRSTSAIGDAIFTTARVHEGRILHAALHEQRLVHDAGLLRGAQCGVAWQGIAPDEVRRVVAIARRGAELKAREHQEGVARIVLVPVAGQLVTHTELLPPRRARWQAGDAPLCLVLREDPRPADAPLVKAHQRERLSALEAEARDRGVDGALLERNGWVCEGTWFHVLARWRGRWWTPPVGSHAIFGTTRLAALRSLRARGQEVVERPLPVAALPELSGLWALSSLLHVAPVARVEGLTLPVGEGGVP